MQSPNVKHKFVFKWCFSMTLYKYIYSSNSINKCVAHCWVTTHHFSFMCGEALSSFLLEDLLGESEMELFPASMMTNLLLALATQPERIFL